ncbi:hypothetical protein Tco_0424320 [Tanacetum coccineum]
MMILENKLESLKLLENKLESMMILENKLESLKLQENQPVDGLTQFDLRPHKESDRWPQIYAGIQQHLQKIYNGKKDALKERYYVPEEDGTYNLERLRRGRPSYISGVDWDAQLAFWNDPKNLARAAQNKQNRAKSKVMETSLLEIPVADPTLLLDTYCWSVFFEPRGQSLYATGSRIQHLHGVTDTEDRSWPLFRGGQASGAHSRSDDKFSQMLNQFESQPEYGGGSGSGGCGDDEPGR